MAENVKSSKSIEEFVNELVENLPEWKRKKFNKFFKDDLYNRGWCRRNQIDYVNPNVLDAKIKAYKEFVRIPDSDLKKYFD